MSTPLLSLYAPNRRHSRPRVSSSDVGLNLQPIELLSNEVERFNKELSECAGIFPTSMVTVRIRQGFDEQSNFLRKLPIWNPRYT